METTQVFQASRGQAVHCFALSISSCGPHITFPVATKSYFADSQQEIDGKISRLHQQWDL